MIIIMILNNTSFLRKQKNIKNQKINEIKKMKR